jgi:multicomponent Na+:H+ antiporter subunit E
VPWLLGQILLANLRIFRLVFHPRMMERIDPHIVRFQSSLENPLALVTFANSITLTPGTITVTLTLDGQFKVHAIDKPSGEALPDAMEDRIREAFGGSRAWKSCS